MVGEGKSVAGFSPTSLGGLAISREAWLAHIDGDSELRIDHADDQLVIASWRDREGIFCYRHGVVTPQSADSEVVHKLGAIASSDSSQDSELGIQCARRRSKSARRRKVIPRAKAAAIVAIAGLMATALGKAWLDRIFPTGAYLSEPPVWWAFFARSLYMTGLAAVFAAWILSVSSLFPWEKRSSLYAAAAFCACVAVFLIL